MVLKSRRSHFWQIAVSCDCHSHDVRLTHHPMHDIFLFWNVPSQLKLEGKKSSFYIVNRKKKSTLWRLFSSRLQKRRNCLPCPPTLHPRHPQGRHMVQNAISSGGKPEAIFLIWKNSLHYLSFLCFRDQYNYPINLQHLFTIFAK